MEGYEAQREAWEEEYAQAEARWKAHKEQVAKALEADTEAAATRPDPAENASYSTESEDSTGTLASDEALAALREKLTGE